MRTEKLAQIVWGRHDFLEFDKLNKRYKSKKGKFIGPIT